MVNNYCPTCQHDKNSIGFCDKCFYSRLLEEKGIAPTMYERRPTNADRIRAMSDDELAEWVHDILVKVNGNPEITPTERFIFDWLRQEAEE